MFNDETKVVSTESFDPLTDTGKIKALLSEQERRILKGVSEIIAEREQAHRSFWRAVFNAVKSGAEQSFAELKRIIKE